LANAAPVMIGASRSDGEATLFKTFDFAGRMMQPGVDGMESVHLDRREYLNL